MNDGVSHILVYGPLSVHDGFWATYTEPRS